MLVQDVMHSPVLTVAPAESLRTAYRMMQEHDIRHLPVLEDGRLAGVVTDRDLRLATSTLSPQPCTPEVPVAQVMTRHVLTAGPLDPIEEAARVMHDRKVGCLPVEEEGRLVGILTGPDLLGALLRMTGLAHPSSRLAVRILDEPGTLAKLTALIDARDVNIHSVLTYTEGDHTHVVLRVGTADLRALAEALRVAGFDVSWP